MLLDTNALFLVVQAHFPLEAEVDRHRPGAVLLVPSSVVGELDRLVDASTPGAAAARAVAERFDRVGTVARGDAGVMDAAERSGAWVVTADRALQARLRRRGITVLRPRDRSRLDLVPGRPPTEPRAPSRGRSSRRRGNS